MEEEILSVLKKVAKDVEWQNYKFHYTTINASAGDGFLSEFYRASIENTSSGDILHLGLKLAPKNEHRRLDGKIEQAYAVERYFYSEVIPVLTTFQKENGVSNPCGYIPKYFTSITAFGNEAIVLEDVSAKQFVLRRRDLLFDDDHVKLIFKTYAEFHAASFALKDQRSEIYEKITENIPCDVWKYFISTERYKNFSGKVYNEAAMVLTDPKMMESFKKYQEKGHELLLESYDANDEAYTTILHGDCWSNNLMFKYQDSINMTKPQDMKLLDFQMFRVATVVHDLAYFFYSGGSKEIFDNLEKYLDEYYDHFVNFARKLCSNGEKLLPRHVLNEQWKKYAKYGMAVAMGLAKIKLVKKEDMAKLLAEEETDGENFKELPFDEKLYYPRIKDLLVHIYEINAL